MLHYIEILATFAGIANIYLAARANIWNWFFGLIMVSLYMFIFYQAKLYADMVLQIVYFVLQFYGLSQWLWGGKNKSALNVSKTPVYVYFIAPVLIGALYCIFAYSLSHYTDSTTIWIDAFTTAASLVAQWMMSKKWLENWWLWILVDIISIKMYLIKHLYLTSGLYALFLIICCYGFYVWRKSCDSYKIRTTILSMS